MFAPPPLPAMPDYNAKALALVNAKGEVGWLEALSAIGPKWHEPLVEAALNHIVDTGQVDEPKIGLLRRRQP